MSEPFLGQIKPWGLAFAPEGWAFCDGQILPISQYMTLSSILGTTYGGNGTTTFALPDLRGRTPVHVGNTIPLGAVGGEESHALSISEIPAHTHAVSGSSNDATAALPTGALWATVNATPYSSAPPDTQLDAAAIGSAGMSQSHSNMQPYLTLNFCIAIAGVYPARN